MNEKLREARAAFLMRLTGAAFTSSHITSDLFQQLLNHRARTFAGSYRIVAFVDLVYQVSVASKALAIFTGSYRTMPGLSLEDVFALSFAVVGIYQAISFHAPRTEDENHVE